MIGDGMKFFTAVGTGSLRVDMIQNIPAFVSVKNEPEKV